MNKWYLICFSLLFCFLTRDIFPDDKMAYSVSLYVGIVKYSQNNGSSWKKVFPDLALIEQALLKTGRNSYCDILMPNRGVFRVMDNTLVQIKELKKQVEEIKVKKGRAMFSVNRKLEKDESFMVETSVANAAVRGTKFEIDADSTDLDVSVAEGTVSITRNVNIPDEYKDDEQVQSLLTVDAASNQTIKLTMEENKELEDHINRVKNNKDEVLKALQDSHDATAKKLQIMKRNINRVFDELEKSDEKQNTDLNNNNNNDDDETQNTIDKVKKHEK